MSAAVHIHTGANLTRPAVQHATATVRRGDDNVTIRLTFGLDSVVVHVDPEHADTIIAGLAAQLTAAAGVVA